MLFEYAANYIILGNRVGRRTLSTGCLVLAGRGPGRSCIPLLINSNPYLNSLEDLTSRIDSRRVRC